MKSLLLIILAIPFLSACGSSKKNTASPGTERIAVASAPGWKMHSPYDNEYMIMINAKGQAKHIPDEWSVDTSAHMPYKIREASGNPSKYAAPESVSKKKKRRVSKSKAKKSKRKRKPSGSKRRRSN